MPIFECNMDKDIEKVGKDNYENGYDNGLEQGKTIGEFNTLAELYKDGNISLDIALKKLGITEDEFLAKL